MGQIHSIKRPSAWQNMEQISSRPKDGKNKAKSKTVDEELVPQVDRDMKEKREDGAVRIVLISDTHNKHKMLELPEGDILIQAGDFTNNGTKDEFNAWLASLDFQHKITHLALNVCRLAFHLCCPHFLLIKRRNSKIQRLVSLQTFGLQHAAA